MISFRPFPYSACFLPGSVPGRRARIDEGARGDVRRRHGRDGAGLGGRSDRAGDPLAGLRAVRVELAHGLRDVEVVALVVDDELLEADLARLELFVEPRARPAALRPGALEDVARRDEVLLVLGRVPAVEVVDA